MLNQMKELRKIRFVFFNMTSSLIYKGFQSIQRQMYLFNRWQGCHAGESMCLPTMWTAINFRTSYHVKFELIIIGLFSAFTCFFIFTMKTPVFPCPQKPRMIWFKMSLIFLMARESVLGYNSCIALQI